MASELSAINSQPTRIRYGVLAFACSLSMITYLDRVCIGKAAPHLWEALGFETIEDISFAFAAFSVAYAAFEIPSGILGDLFGPKKVLIRIVLWWSVFTSLTSLTGKFIWGVQFGFAALVAVRFLFGMGEAGAYPNITRALHNWFPFQQRGLAQGSVWMAGRLMGGLTPLIWVYLVEGFTTTAADGTTIHHTKPLLSWESCFWLFGGIGVTWCVLFAWWFRNRPEENPAVNAAERDLIVLGRGEEEGHRGIPWRKLLLSYNVWALGLMYFCGSYAWYFNINYLPSFLQEQYGLPGGDVVGAIYAGGPLWMGAIACLLGGYLTDWFIRKTKDRKGGRRWFGILGHGLCGMCFLAALAAPNAFWFFLAVSLAAFFNDLTMGAAWATCQDIGRRYAATVAGFMNTVGNAGGAVSAQISGMILGWSVASYERAHNVSLKGLEIVDKVAASGALREAHHLGYQMNLASFAAVIFVAVILWFFIDPTRPIDANG